MPKREKLISSMPYHYGVSYSRIEPETRGTPAGVDAKGYRWLKSVQRGDLKHT
ncbi:hypothetical protein ACSS6W_006464 [Trichoderma asperelloides]